MGVRTAAVARKETGIYDASGAKAWSTAEDAEEQQGIAAYHVRKEKQATGL